MARTKKLKAVVAPRGQVTIPKAIRDQAGIVAGTVLEFDLQGGKLVLSKRVVGDPIAAVYGCLKDTIPYKTTDEYIAEIRGSVK